VRPASTPKQVWGVNAAHTAPSISELGAHSAPGRMLV
jgi:hypothetical protein